MGLLWYAIYSEGPIVMMCNKKKCNYSHVATYITECVLFGEFAHKRSKKENIE